jgi:hypothetical protein
MTISFADGTRIEIPASAFDDFIKHDLKWVEFVHGRAESQFSSQPIYLADASKQNVKRCPAC